MALGICLFSHKSNSSIKQRTRRCLVFSGRWRIFQLCGHCSRMSHMSVWWTGVHKVLAISCITWSKPCHVLLMPPPFKYLAFPVRHVVCYCGVVHREVACGTDQDGFDGSGYFCCSKPCGKSVSIYCSCFPLCFRFIIYKSVTLRGCTEFWKKLICSNKTIKSNMPLSPGRWNAKLIGASRCATQASANHALARSLWCVAAPVGRHPWPSCWSWAIQRDDIALTLFHPVERSAASHCLAVTLVSVWVRVCVHRELMTTVISASVNFFLSKCAKLLLAFVLRNLSLWVKLSKYWQTLLGLIVLPALPQSNKLVSFALLRSCCDGHQWQQHVISLKTW